MTEYNKGDIGNIGCVLSLTVRANYEGILEPEELEGIDKEMLQIGSSRTGQRVDVTTTAAEDLVSVEYVYQESVLTKSLFWAEERLEAFTVLEEPFIVVDVVTAEFKED